VQLAQSQIVARTFVIHTGTESYRLIDAVLPNHQSETLIYCI